MRTTIRLDDALLRQIKSEAARLGVSLTRMIEDALRERMARIPETAATRARVRLNTFRGRGLQPGVDLDDSAALLDLMNESR